MRLLVSINEFPGLATGPFDHEASSVINVISNTPIDMGSVVDLVTTPLPEGELLPRVKESTVEGSSLSYGIAVGGDADGIYGDGSQSTDDTTRATNGAGQGVKICTRGRCLARVTGSNAANVGVTIKIGDPLTSKGAVQNVFGELFIATLSTETVIARALQGVTAGNQNISLVEVNKEGNL